MNKFPKIQSIYKRDPDTHKFDDRYSMPEFGYLAYAWWTFSEKLDGMNMRAGYDPVTGVMTIAGRTDMAEIPGMLMDRMRELFPVEKVAEFAGGHAVMICGEGIGSKIQRGSDYLPPSDTGAADFVLFDVKVGGHWSSRVEVAAAARVFGCREAPMVGDGSIGDAVIMAREGFASELDGAHKRAEGLVIRPTVELRGRWGQRIIAKVKTKDFN